MIKIINELNHHNRVSQKAFNKSLKIIEQQTFGLRLQNQTFPKLFSVLRNHSNNVKKIRVEPYIFCEIKRDLKPGITTHEEIKGNGEGVTDLAE